MAQLGIAFSLAYIALPFFRHTQRVADRASRIIGPTEDERQGFLKLFYQRPMADAEDYDELQAIIRIVNLIEARTCSRLGTLCESALPRRTDARGRFKAQHPWKWSSLDLVQHAFDEATSQRALAQSPTRRRYLRTFFVGGDVVVVFGGVVFALYIHGLAFLETVYPVAHEGWLTTPIVQWAFVLVLLGWCCGAPVYFAYQSGRLNAILQDFFKAASTQAAAVGALQSDSAEREIEATLDKVPLRPGGSPRRHRTQ